MVSASIYLISPKTDACKEWIDEHVESDNCWLGNNLAVEHRYIDDLVHGMIEWGLEPNVDFEVYE